MTVSPLNIQIQTTSVCNGRCIICPYPDSWHHSHPGRMDDALFDVILDQLAPLSLGKVCMYLENEPLMDPAIFDRIEQVKARLSFASLEFSTNAQALGVEQVERLAEEFAGVKHEVWVSFHGVNKRTYEGTMGLDFEQGLTNIIRLLKLSDRLPLRVIIRGAGLPVSPELTHDFTFTEDEYQNFWKGQLTKHGIHTRPGINYIRYHDRAGTIRRNTLRLQRIVRPDLTNFSCPRVGGWLHVLYTGELTICCMDYHREEIFGDLRIQKLVDILAGPTYRRLKDRVEGREPAPHDFICKRCISPGG